MGYRALQVAYAALVLTGACQAFLLPPVFFGGALRQVVHNLRARVCAHEVLACDARARLAREPQEADAGVRRARERDTGTCIKPCSYTQTRTSVCGRSSGRARAAPALRMSGPTPTWSDIKQRLVDLEPAPTAEPVLTLYRDNNGWCPFCERVWVALLVKGVPFKEETLSLQKKPQWYLDKVPTGLVPAIEFAGSGSELVWESKDILLRLEAEEFAQYKTLLPAGEKQKALALLDECDNMTKSMAGVLYGSNATSTELEAKMQAFEGTIDRIEQLLSASKSPFFLDSGFSVVDCMLIPVLERLAVQLPLKTGMALRSTQRWPALEGWFAALETEIAPYRDRVMGDPYSWSAAFVTILQMFQSTAGVGSIDPIANAQAQVRPLLRMPSSRLQTCPRSRMRTHLCSMPTGNG